MIRWPPRVLLFWLLVVNVPAMAREGDTLDALHRQDARLARIAESMLIANRGLCRRTMPVIGAIIHSRDQYGTADVEGFADGPVAISAIVPRSPAERAGLMRGDAVLAVAGETLEGLTPAGDFPVRDAVFEMLAAQPPATPIELRIRRAGEEMTVSVEPQEGCRALVEVLADERIVARSDGRVIQVSYGLAEKTSDEGLAAVFAHELAHLVLEHRRRLSEAGVAKGFFGEFGSNRRRNRQAEVEADRLSVHLLAKAGLDPQVAPRFWLSSEGRRADRGILRSAIYPSPNSRAEIMQREIAKYLPAGSAPAHPEHLLSLREGEF